MVCMCINVKCVDFSVCLCNNVRQIDAYFVGAKRKKADADDAVKFMASIGWISGKDLVLPPNPSMAIQAAQGAAMNAGMANKGAPYGRTSHSLEVINIGPHVHYVPV